MDMSSNTPMTPRFRHWRSPWVAGLLLFLVYVAVSAGTILFVEHRLGPSFQIMFIAVPWLAVGVGVTGVLLGGARLWPALFAGSWVVWGVIVHDAPISVTVDAVAEAGSIVLIARLLSIWGFHRSFDRLRDPLILLAAATVGRILAVTLDLVGTLATSLLTPGAFAEEYRAALTAASGTFPAATPGILSATIGWVLNSIAGIMLVVPLASATADELRKTYLRQPIPLLALAAALLAWSTAALTLTKSAASPVLITALMLAAWAAIRFGPTAAAFATLTMSLVATAGVDMRLGPLAISSPMENIGLQWGFIALLALTGLSLTALLAERRRDRERLTAIAQRYQRLFQANPSPLWVAAPGSGRILMVNDEAMRRYGYSEAEFLDMTIAQLAVEPESRASAPGAGGGGVRSLRHRIRGGECIDVEMQSTRIELDGRFVELIYAVDVTDRIELRSRILAAAAIERGRLAQELHDGLGQVLAGLSLGAQAAARRGRAVDRAFVDFLVDASHQAANLWRQVTRGVSPLQDANGDLLDALRRLPDSMPPDSCPRFDIEIDSRAPLSLSLERSEHLYRVVQEALVNALKHAHAAHIRVQVAVTPETVRIIVEDDGVGVQDAARGLHGLGMRSMGLRAQAIGATIEVAEGPGGGTLIRCECAQQEPIQIPHVAERAFSDPGEPRTHSVPESGSIPSISPSVITYVGRCLLLAAACFSGFTVSALLAGITDPRINMNNSSRMAVPSLLFGFSVAGLLLGGGRLWPGIGLGALLGALVLLHEPPSYALYYSATAVVASLVSLELLSRWHFRRAFAHWQDPLLLCGAAIVGCSVFSAFAFMGIMTYQWLRPGEFIPSIVALVTNAAGASPVMTGAFLAALGRWWLDGVAGVVLFVPLLVATPPIWRTLRGHFVEAAFWFAALLGWVACMFMLSDAGARLPLVASALALLVWAVVRFGVAMASLATVVCAMSATLSFASQRGVLTTIGVNEGVDTLWGFLLLLAGIGMFVTSLLAERNRRLHDLALTAQRARRLFERDPHPLWVQDSATGRILMVNEQAVRHYGYSEVEWLALTVDDLAANPASAIIARPTHDFARVETRHRRKSGAVIDVELWYAPIDMKGRPTLLCFAIDVTERNTLQRGFLEATDRERRRLADELHHGLGRALAELELAAKGLEQRDGAGRAELSAIECVAQASRRATDVCRQAAHSVNRQTADVSAEAVLSSV
ncbi:MAG TPA: PAS domain S-box protein [Steroidobacteraceae bacterium]|nr:PAS domain S-box protein [Steroidobacteraceae bacterium]